MDAAHQLVVRYVHPSSPKGHGESTNACPTPSHPTVPRATSRASVTPPVLCSADTPRSHLREGFIPTIPAMPLKPKKRPSRSVAWRVGRRRLQIFRNAVSLRSRPGCGLPTAPDTVRRDDIDALRGLAVLLMVMVHVAATAPPPLVPPQPLATLWLDWLGRPTLRRLPVGGRGKPRPWRSRCARAGLLLTAQAFANLCALHLYDPSRPVCCLALFALIPWTHASPGATQCADVGSVGPSSGIHAPRSGPIVMGRSRGRRGHSEAASHLC